MPLDTVLEPNRLEDPTRLSIELRRGAPSGVFRRGPARVFQGRRAARHAWLAPRASQCDAPRSSSRDLRVRMWPRTAPATSTTDRCLLSGSGAPLECRCKHWRSSTPPRSNHAGRVVDPLRVDASCSTALTRRQLPECEGHEARACRAFAEIASGCAEPRGRRLTNSALLADVGRLVYHRLDSTRHAPLRAAACAHHDLRARLLSAAGRAIALRRRASAGGRAPGCRRRSDARAPRDAVPHVQDRAIGTPIVVCRSGWRSRRSSSSSDSARGSSCWTWLQRTCCTNGSAPIVAAVACDPDRSDTRKTTRFPGGLS